MFLVASAPVCYWTLQVKFSWGRLEREFNMGYPKLSCDHRQVGSVLSQGSLVSM